MAFTRNFDKEYADAMAAANAQGWATGKTDYSVVQKIVADRDAEAAKIRAANEAWNRANSGGGGSSVSGLSSAPQAIPSLPVFTPDKRLTNLVKEAPIDTIVFDENNVDIALISDLIFEDIGATELANISRFDYIDGQEIYYSPIANLSYIRRQFNPNNIVSIGAEADYFSRFGINLITRGLKEPYFDENGDLVIEIENISSEEDVQVQVLSNGTIDLVDE